MSSRTVRREQALESGSHRAPVFDLALLRDRRVAVANALTLVGSVGFYALSLSTVIYLMTVWDYSPLRAGLAMTPAPFGAGTRKSVKWPVDFVVSTLRLLDMRLKGRCLRGKSRKNDNRRAQARFLSSM